MTPTLEYSPRSRTLEQYSYSMEKRLKIGFVATSLSSFGGWDRCAMGVIPAMAEIADVKVLTRVDLKNEITDPRVEMHAVLPGSISYSFRNQWKVFKEVMKYHKDCDVLHTMMEPYHPAVAFAGFLLRKPVFLTLAGTYAVPPRGYSPKAIVKRMVMQFMYAQTSMIASGSERAYTRAGEVVKMGPWRFIPNGINIEEFHKIPETYPHPFLLTVGEIKPRKGQDYTAKALAKLKDRFPNLHYKIVGDTSHALKFVDIINTFAEKEGIKDRVEFLGRVSDEDLQKLYGACEVFVLAAQTTDDNAFEGFPMVFYEAQACGAPLISTYGFGSEYVIKNGENGYLVHEASLDELVEAIEKIVGNQALRTKMVERSLEEARIHSWLHTAKLYFSMYADALKIPYIK